MTALTRWAQSGLMSLTGEPGGFTDSSPAFAYAAFEVHLERLTQWLGLSNEDPLADPAVVLGGRARENNFTRGGQTSAGGATRLIQGADGWGALSLARETDRELVPALLGTEIGNQDIWRAVEQSASSSVRALVERAATMGMPTAMLGEARQAAGTSVQISKPRKLQLRDAVVVDLSALWAGPLSTAFLAAGGAQVIKVEFANRPDGARQGNQRFFDWLGHRKLMCVIEDSAEGEAFLARLIDVADIVIEASRPRALHQRGLAYDQRQHADGKIWVRITGHGTKDGAEHRVAFGDDAAVAGGLVGRNRSGAPVFMGDAVADPLTGVKVANEVAAAIDAGGGRFIDISMSGVAAEYASAITSLAVSGDTRKRPGEGWHGERRDDAMTPVSAPPRIPLSPPAHALGEDNRVVRALVASRESASGVLPGHY
ncbi:CoA transferase [Leucobacter denitrificans]|uniref:CoA transferase n=1 Tax=Leucobacter denitrificans TaxID=683042 RepID=A0A7G9S537_9MICO|nr:CoA transferase [Leucobacter denitrificans]QNN62962.1 CoA transferase [Leucobacter denitrificans]